MECMVSFITVVTINKNYIQSCSSHQMYGDLDSMFSVNSFLPEGCDHHVVYLCSILFLFTHKNCSQLSLKQPPLGQEKVVA